MSPRSPEQFAHLREERRQEILMAALRLFADQGFEATSISQIARETGMSKGLLYNYFASKQQLLEEMVNVVFQKIGSSFQEILSYSGGQGFEGGGTILAKILTLNCRLIEEDTNFFKLYARIGIQLYEKMALPRRLYEVEDAWNRTIAHMLQDLGQSHERIEVALFHATLDGVNLHYLFHFEKYPLQEAYNRIWHRYTAGQKPDLF